MKNITFNSEVAKNTMTVNEFKEANNFKKWLAKDYEDTLENIASIAMRQYLKPLQEWCNSFEIIEVAGEIEKCRSTVNDYYYNGSKHLDVWIDGLAKNFPTSDSQDNEYLEFCGYMSDILQGNNALVVKKYKRA